MEDTRAMKEIKELRRRNVTDVVYMLFNAPHYTAMAVGERDGTIPSFRTNSPSEFSLPLQSTTPFPKDAATANKNGKVEKSFQVKKWRF